MVELSPVSQMAISLPGAHVAEGVRELPGASLMRKLIPFTSLPLMTEPPPNGLTS